MTNSSAPPGTPGVLIQAKLLQIPIFVLIAFCGTAFAQTPNDAPVTTLPNPGLEKNVSAWDAPEPWRTDRFYLETSIYTHHFQYDPAHNDDQNLLLGEWNVTEKWLVGVAFLDNSFGQPTQYVYGGYRFRPLENVQPFYLKLSAGIIHGYEGEYQHKIPLNDSGYAPVVIPTIGYCFNRFCSELVVFGLAGVMVTVGVTIP